MGPIEPDVSLRATSSMGFLTKKCHLDCSSHRSKGAFVLTERRSPKVWQKPSPESLGSSKRITHPQSAWRLERSRFLAIQQCRVVKHESDVGDSKIVPRSFLQGGQLHPARIHTPTDGETMAATRRRKNAFSNCLARSSQHADPRKGKASPLCSPDLPWVYVDLKCLSSMMLCFVLN